MLMAALSFAVSAAMAQSSSTEGFLSAGNSVLSLDEVFWQDFVPKLIRRQLPDFLTEAERARWADVQIVATGWSKTSSLCSNNFRPAGAYMQPQGGVTIELCIRSLRYIGAIAEGLAYLPIAQGSEKADELFYRYARYISSIALEDTRRSLLALTPTFACPSWVFYYLDSMGRKAERCTPADQTRHAGAALDWISNLNTSMGKAAAQRAPPSLADKTRVANLHTWTSTLYFAAALRMLTLHELAHLFHGDLQRQAGSAPGFLEMERAADRWAFQRMVETANSDLNRSIAVAGASLTLEYIRHLATMQPRPTAVSRDTQQRASVVYKSQMEMFAQILKGMDPESAAVIRKTWPLSESAPAASPKQVPRR